MNQFKFGRFLCASITAVFIATASAADGELKTDDEKMFYYLGTALSSNLVPLQLSEDEVGLVIRGLSDSLKGNAIEVDPETYGQRLNQVAQARMAEGAAQESGAAAAYVAKMAAEDGAIQLDSGVVVLDIEAGEGASPTANSSVTAHYHGTLRDGKVFDSSVARGQPFKFSLEKVIPCWREAIPTMKVGGKSKITCPPEMAYGPRGSGVIPPGAALTFEVELIEVVD